MKSRDTILDVFSGNKERIRIVFSTDGGFPNPCNGFYMKPLIWVQGIGCNHGFRYYEDCLSVDQNKFETMTYYSENDTLLTTFGIDNLNFPYTYHSILDVTLNNDCSIYIRFEEYQPSEEKYNIWSEENHVYLQFEETFATEYNTKVVDYLGRTLWQQTSNEQTIIIPKQEIGVQGFVIFVETDEKTLSVPYMK